MVRALITAITLASIALLQLNYSMAQDGPLILVGYGGERYLPLVNGAELNFEVGERLSALATKRWAKIYLTSPNGTTYAYSLSPDEEHILYRFGPKDVGVWEIRGEIGSMKINVKERGRVESVLLELQQVGGSNVRVSVVGSTLVGFAMGEGEEYVAAAGGFLDVPLLRGVDLVNVELLYEEPIILTGDLQGVGYTYRTEALIASYIIKSPKDDNNTRVELPDIGEVGQNGLVPLRYGKIEVKVSYSGQGITGVTRKYSVFIGPDSVRIPKLSRFQVFNIVELLRGPISIIYLDIRQKELRTLNVWIPVYRVMVYDYSESSFVEDYSIINEGMISIKRDEITYLIPSLIPLSEIDAYKKVRVRPVVEVYGVDISEEVRSIELSREGVSVIKIKSKEVSMSVRHVSGFEVEDGSLYINGTYYGRVSGKITMRLPEAIYNITVTTPLGTASIVADVSKQSRIDIIIRGLTTETRVLIFTFTTLVAISSYQTYKLIKLKRQLKNKGVEALKSFNKA